MSKKTPDRKVAQGGVVGTLLGAVTSILAIVFHQHLPVSVVSSIPAVVGVAGHFLGSYFAPYVPRAEELVAYVKKLLPEAESVINAVPEPPSTAPVK